MINKEWKKELLAKVGDTINCKECIHGETCNVAGAHGGKVAGCEQFQYKPPRKMTVYVVRCDECVYWCGDPEYCTFFDFPTAEHDYCSRGVHKR